MPKRLAILSLAALASLALAAPALAVSLSGPVNDCQTHGGQLKEHWSVAQLRSALVSMPVDVREYSDCYDVIQKALLAQIHDLGGGGSSGGGGSFLPVWLIVVLALLVLGAAGLGAVALRNRDRGP